MSTAIQDAEVVDVAEVTQALAVVPSPPVTLAVTPTVKASELVARLDVIREAMDHAMKRDVDYGVIPGTDKPALLKPGAEKLGVLFQLDVQLVNEKVWGPGDHLTVMSHATVFHAPTGARLGYGEGLCSTREKKYAYRKQERTCPTCGKASVIKGKAEYGGGWLCWKKRDGCGATFTDGSQEIESQPVGEVDNPDLPDLWNTMVKMAEKRARVDAVLAVTGASALFTQDVDEQQPPVESAPSSQPLGQPMDASLKSVIGGACRQLCGDDAEKGRALFMAVKKDCDGVMPQAAALALIDAAEAVHRLEHPETLAALEVD